MYAVSSNLNRNNHHGRITRTGLDFNLPVHRTALFARKRSYTGARLLFLPNSANGRLEAQRRKCWFGKKTLFTINEFPDHVNDRDNN